MHRIALLGLILAITAGSAGAATLTVTPDKTTYQVGESIMLSVSGDAEGASDSRIAGRVLFDAGLADYVTSDQDPLTSFGFEWFTDPLSGGVGFADAFLQVLFNGGIPDGPLSATVTLRATAPGTLEYAWMIEGDDNWTLDFFGLMDAPGGSVVIVPEPGTGGLVVAGLLAIWGARKRTGLRR